MNKFFFFLLLSICQLVHSQSDNFISYDKKNYEIQSIIVSGNQFTDAAAIISITGLRIGQKISVPGTEIPTAIKALYRQKLFSQVEILFDEIQSDLVKINIKLTEKPRYTTHSFKGVKKAAHDELNELFNSQINKNTIVTDDVKENIIYKITEHFISKGYLDAKVKIHEIPDEKMNKVRLVVDIKRSKRVKVGRIKFNGNESISDFKLRRKMKETKLWTKIFTKSKYIEKLYEEDKQNVIDYYSSKGFRDVAITSDSVYRTKSGKIGIDITIDEGKKYYFRNIKIKGNSLFSEDQIKKIMAINSGDVYNLDLLQKRLSFSQDGRDVSSLYMDDGYLFFRAEPVEIGIERDSVDVEVRIFEGPQATIDKVTISGNGRTHENVVRRELRTRPGQKFSRSDIIRSQRAIMALGFFNPESMGINTPVNPKRGTVDIDYTVEERPSDQLELSAGYSQLGLVGTLGVVFNNFSTKNILKKESWSPLPQGDGQKLSLRAQSNGRFFQSYNFSFTEPWLGNKKPNSLTIGAVYSLFNSSSSDRTSKFSTLRFSGALGSQLQWPDDNFTRITALNVEKIKLTNYTGFQANNQAVSNGTFYNISLKHTIARSTVNEPLYPRSGSRISLACQLTPPYSLFRKNYNPDSLSVADRYKWVEYHKWRFDGEWYFNIVNKLVLSFNAKMGFVGFYNRKLGSSAFEKFRLGGDGLGNQNFAIAGRDIIALRGYEVSDVTRRKVNDPSNIEQDGTIFNKFTLELRYPLSLNPSATIYATTFFQGGNQWNSFREYNPFLLKRSAGVGLRVFLPMFGLLGFDYGFGLDKPWLDQANSPVKSYGRFSLILGFEPD